MWAALLARGGDVGMVAVVVGVLAEVVPALVVVQQGGQVQVEVEDAVAGVGRWRAHQEDAGAVHQTADQIEAVLAFALGGGGDALQVLGG